MVVVIRNYSYGVDQKTYNSMIKFFLLAILALLIFKALYLREIPL